MLRNTNLIFISSMLAGLLLPGLAGYLVGYVLFFLMVIMTFSTTQITLGTVDLRKEGRQIFLAFISHYVFLSGIILLASKMLLDDPELIAGFIVMAAVPCGIGVVPFTTLLKGNTYLSLVSAAVLYVLSPVLAPVIVYLVGGLRGIDIWELIKVLVELIVIPLFFSRIIVRLRAYEKIRDHQIVIINIAYFFLIYAVVGINRNAFFTDIVYIVSLIAVLRTFVSGGIVYLVSKMAGVERGTAVTYTFFGSIKNLGLTATIALALLSERATIPAVICIPFELVFFTFFSWLLDRDSVPQK